MVDDNRTYTLNQYLFDVEDYIALGIKCDIILPKSVWSSVFKDCGVGIWSSISNEYSVSVSFNISALTGYNVIHFVKQLRKTNEYSSEVYTLATETINKIRTFNREVKIDNLIG